MKHKKALHPIVVLGVGAILICIAAFIVAIVRSNSCRYSNHCKTELSEMYRRLGNINHNAAETLEKAGMLEGLCEEENVVGQLNILMEKYTVECRDSKLGFTVMVTLLGKESWCADTKSTGTTTIQNTQDGIICR